MQIFTHSIVEVKGLAVCLCEHCYGLWLSVHMEYINMHSEGLTLHPSIYSFAIHCASFIIACTKSKDDTTPISQCRVTLQSPPTKKTQKKNLTSLNKQSSTKKNKTT